MRSAID
jgi:hypothetical protein